MIRKLASFGLTFAAELAANTADAWLRKRYGIDKLERRVDQLERDINSLTVDTGRRHLARVQVRRSA